MYKVIVIDDEPSILEGLQLMIDFEDLGFTVCAYCNNGADGYDKICNIIPDVVITDIRMPLLNGLDLIKKVAEAGIKSEFIILSGYNDFEYARMALQHGVKYFVLKPIDQEEIGGILKEIHIKLKNTNASYGDLHHEMPAAFHAAGHDKKIFNAVEVLNEEDALLETDKMFKYFEEINAAAQWVDVAVDGLIFDIIQLIKERGFKTEDFIKNYILTKRDVTIVSREAYKTYLIKIIKNAIEYMLSERKKNTQIGYLYEIKEYIESNYKQDISIVQLASAYYIDPAFLGRAFTKKFNISIKDYVHQLRISEAIRMLEDSNMTLLNISKLVGYNNYNNFVTHFEKNTNTTPAEYRNRI